MECPIGGTVKIVRSVKTHASRLRRRPTIEIDCGGTPNMAHSPIPPCMLSLHSWLPADTCSLPVSSCVQDASWKLQASFLPEGWKCLVQLGPIPQSFLLALNSLQSVTNIEYFVNRLEEQEVELVITGMRLCEGWVFVLPRPSLLPPPAVLRRVGRRGGLTLSLHRYWRALARFAAGVHCSAPAPAAPQFPAAPRRRVHPGPHQRLRLHAG